MGKKKDKTIFLEATVKQYYGFEEGKINGWPTEEVIRDWFTTFDINTSHATRDGHHYGNTDCVISVREVNPQELEAEADKYFPKLKAERSKDEEVRNARLLSIGGALADAWRDAEGK